MRSPLLDTSAGVPSTGDGVLLPKTERSQRPTRPLVYGFVALLVVAVAFEPVRDLISWLDLRGSLNLEVGGVGGVGGLTNLGPSVANCTSTPGGLMAPYCFEPGLLFGLTPFALLFIIAWTLPLAISAFAAAAKGEHDRRSMVEPSSHLRTTWVVCTVLACCVWFLKPLIQYLTIPFYEESGWRQLLALSIAAAFPLSWLVSLVAIPSSGADFLPQLLGVSRDCLLSLHKNLAWATVFFGSLHGLTEVAYMSSQHQISAVLRLTSGEDLLYYAGIFSLITVLFTAIVVACRKHPLLKGKRFCSLHRAMAVVLVLCAACHWWPFALFLCPAAAISAVGAASRNLYGSSSKTEDNLGGELPKVDSCACAFALGVALLASPAGTAVVWEVRQIVMARAHADLYTPFLFPPLAVLVGFVSARASAALALRFWSNIGIAQQHALGKTTLHTHLLPHADNNNYVANGDFST